MSEVFAIQYRYYKEDWDPVALDEVYATAEVAYHRLDYMMKNYGWGSDYIRVVTIKVKTDFARVTCPSE